MKHPTPTPLADWDALALRGTFAATLFILVSLAIYVASQSMPHNPLRDETKEHDNYLWWMPEGWGFFTKPAQDPMRSLYVHDGTEWQKVEWRRARIAAWWGLSRRSTVRMMEINGLLDGIWMAAAESCDVDPLHCIEDYESPLEVINRALHPTLCGKIAIVEQPPIPWAWREFENVHMPSQIAVLRVSC